MTIAAAEFELKTPPRDGISSLCFSDTSPSLLAASSWDSTVRLYNVESNECLTQYSHESPVLEAVLCGEDKVYSGGLDGCLYEYDVVSQSKRILLEHKDAVKSVCYAKAHDTVFTGSWDKSVKSKDTRDAQSEKEYPMADKVYSMSIAENMLVVALSQRQILVYDIRNMQKPLQDRDSLLKYQTRTVKCFPDAKGFAVASIEGRVSVEYFDQSEEEQAKKYAFKCHRHMEDGVDVVYPVHALAFHPSYGTFASGGGDGVVNIWDGFSRKRLRQLPKYQTSISALSFNVEGKLLAIAASYAFENGEQEHPADAIFIKPLSDAEVKPKSK